MNDRIFIDTNILVYSIADDVRKREIAEHLLLTNEIVVSPQVLSEFIVVTIRKQILETEKVIDAARKFMQVFHVTSTTAVTIQSALNIMSKYRFSYWDSLILAAALENQCMRVYSEDLQHGQRIEDCLTIINPFHQ